MAILGIISFALELDGIQSIGLYHGCCLSPSHESFLASLLFRANIDSADKTIYSDAGDFDGGDDTISVHEILKAQWETSRASYYHEHWKLGLPGRLFGPRCKKV